ncbi:MAG: phosphate ABC transporter permease family protein, partial [Rhabdaerophilum sp.]
MTGLYYALMIALALGAYILVRGRATTLANGQVLHSRPNYHGLLAASQVVLPMILIHLVGSIFASRFVEHQALTAMDPALLSDELRRGAAFREIREFAAGRGAATATQALQAGAAMYAYLAALTNWAVLGLGLAVGIAMAMFSMRSISTEFRARNRFEKVVRYLLLACATVAVITTIGIVFSVLFETFRFFQKVSPIDFLFGTHWSPQTAIRADQGGSSGSFGMVP